MTTPSEERGATTAAEASRQRAAIIAFTSHTGGIGRTGAVANFAVVLSLAGQRVLVLDAGTEAPRVHEYLRPFHVETLPAEQVLGDELARILVPPAAAEPPDPALRHPDASPLARQYRFPVGIGSVDVIATDPLTPIGRLFPIWMDSVNGLELREKFGRSRVVVLMSLLHHSQK